MRRNLSLGRNVLSSKPSFFARPCLCGVYSDRENRIIEVSLSKEKEKKKTKCAQVKNAKTKHSSPSPPLRPRARVEAVPSLVVVEDDGATVET